MRELTLLVCGLILGIVTGMVFAPPMVRSTRVEITEADLSQELVDALDETGCLFMPLWNTKRHAPGIQVCTLKEIMARGWMFDDDQVMKRLEENK